MATASTTTRGEVHVGFVDVAAQRRGRVVLLVSLVASGQIKLRRIDGWRKIAPMLGSRAAGCMIIIGRCRHAVGAEAPKWQFSETAGGRQ